MSGSSFLRFGATLVSWIQFVGFCWTWWIFENWCFVSIYYYACWKIKCQNGIHGKKHSILRRIRVIHCIAPIPLTRNSTHANPSESRFAEFTFLAPIPRFNAAWNSAAYPAGGIRVNCAQNLQSSLKTTRFRSQRGGFSNSTAHVVHRGGPALV